MDPKTMGLDEYRLLNLEGFSASRTLFYHSTFSKAKTTRTDSQLNDWPTRHPLQPPSPEMLDMPVDPFEVRMRFTQQLQYLSASVSSSKKAAQYALKHRDLDEDLHSCILEQLEKSNMNLRANIMSFIEQFCEMAVKEGHEPYVRMMQRDILRVVDAVVPPDGSGAANVKHVRQVLDNLQDKGILSAETVEDIDAALKDRDTDPEHDDDEEGAQEESSQSKTGSPRNVKAQGTRPDKREIEQRVEEDRERNKRLRESMWAVNGDTQEESQQAWDAVSDTNSDDIRDAEEGVMEQAQVAAEMRGEL